jgi:hypothetical protein
MKVGDKVLVKVEGVLEIAKYPRLCEICLLWIEKGDTFGYYTENYDYETDFEIVNCLSCVNGEKL